MRRVSIFAKGNVDVHDSLHSFRLNNEVKWNGLNASLRQMKPGVTVRLHHETFTRSDALLAARGETPDTLRARHLALGSYPLESQFSDALFRAAPDAFVLSLQADVATGLMRSHEGGHLFYPSNASTWSEEDRAWLRSEFSYVGFLDPDESAENFTKLIERLQGARDAPILIYNLSPFTPGESIHCYQGIGGTISSRIKRFNSNLIEISERTGISIVDVDRLVTRHGAQALKTDIMHLNAEGYELVCHEVVRILDDLGVV